MGVFAKKGIWSILVVGKRAVKMCIKLQVIGEYRHNWSGYHLFDVARIQRGTNSLFGLW